MLIVFDSFLIVCACFGCLHGTATAAFLITGGMGPTLYGFCRDVTGNYRVVHAIACVWILLACFAMINMPRPLRPGEEIQEILGDKADETFPQLH